MSEEDMDQTVNTLTDDEHARNQGVVEAVLITADNPMGAAKLSSVLGNQVGAKEVRIYVDTLNDEYINSGRSFRITEVAGGFQLMVHPEFAPWVRQLMREKVPPRLSPASLETLAILAFKQPLTKAEVEHIRGVAVDGVLKQLMEKGLVRIGGRSDAPGRPWLYGTTRDFLKHFGLKTLSDLPKLRELEELLKEEEERITQGGESPLTGKIEPRTEQAENEAGDVVDNADQENRDDGQSAHHHGASAELEQDENGTPESVSGTGGGGLATRERWADTNGQS